LRAWQQKEETGKPQNMYGTDNQENATETNGK
jgi:hypothetical protein